MRALPISILFLCFLCTSHVHSQDSLQVQPAVDTIVRVAEDTIIAPAPVITIDSARIVRHDPRIATRRSLILPGWGQAYNREYWKIPVVWGAIGTCVGFWIYNNTWYKRTRDAYIIVFNNDTSNFNRIHPRLISEQTGKPLDAISIQNYRNLFRRDRDYSLLYFLGAWALNVVDATVFAHLKEFDVSDDLSLKVTPNLNPITRTAGFTLAFNVR